MCGGRGDDVYPSGDWRAYLARLDIPLLAGCHGFLTGVTAVHQCLISPAHGRSEHGDSDTTAESTITSSPSSAASASPSLQLQGEGEGQ